MTTLTIPQAIAALPGRQLPMTPCAGLKGNLLSGAGNTDPIGVTFDNQSDETVHVYWIDYVGQPILYFDLVPGESYTQGTFASHLWLVTGADDECVGLFRARNQDATATIP